MLIVFPPSFLPPSNIIHGSDKVDAANHEIALWFPEGITEYNVHLHPWIYE